MASDALVNWRSARAEHLDELVEAHQSVGGTSPGRRWRTEQINFALALRLAVEFQGFSRELHDVASRTFGSWASPDDQRVAEVIANVLTHGRHLDRANATEESLSSDFSRLGFQFWSVMKSVDPRTSSRLTELRRLNRARNAIAHDNPHVLVELRREGRPITLTTIRRWRSSLNSLAATMDGAVAHHLGNVFGRTQPW